jgi:lipoprotein-anchoring transpeptidase ErfK/SrfK
MSTRVCWRKCCCWIGHVNKRFLNTKDTKEKEPQRFFKIPLRNFVPFVFIKWYASVFLLFLVLLISACGPAVTPNPTSTPTASPIPTATGTATTTPTQTPTVTPTAEPAWFQPLDPALGSLKYQYAEVVNKRAKVYASLQDAQGKTGNYGYLPKSPAYVAYTITEAREGATFYFVPVNYGWMNGQDLQPLTPSSFTGLLPTREVAFRFGWVLAETHSVNTAGAPVQKFERYQVVHEVPAIAQKPGYIAIGADEWLPDSSVALVSPAVPAEAGPDTCRFIYANLLTQTLSVFDKCKLVFATLISSGKNSWTFEGRFTILYKVNYSSIISPKWSTSEYYIEGVPYFMTYSGDFGFHGAYWQDAFGAAASHGCINLAPADAKWLYDWARLGEWVIISSGE